MKTKRIAKILGLGLAVALAFSLGAGIGITPASADVHEWSTINTPSWEDNVILPGSDLRDMAIGGENGDIIYVVARLGCIREVEWDDVGDCQDFADYGLFKSEDGGVTWDDITQAVYEASALPDPSDDDFDDLYYVAVAPDDDEWVAVVGKSCDSNIWVVASQDAGDNFTFAGEVMDAGNATEIETVFDMAVSIEVDGIHNIAVAGINDANDGAVYRLEAGTWLTGSWEDTTFYDGWDDHTNVYPNGFDVNTQATIAVDFSKNFDIDDTIITMGASNPYSGAIPGDMPGATLDSLLPYIQQGTWGSDNSWNAEAGFTDAIEISSDGDTLLTGGYLRAMGFALPMDYDGTDGGSRSIYCYVNAYNVTTELVGGFLFRVDDGSVSEAYGPSGEPLLASIDFHGDADTGKMMVGEYIEWDNDADNWVGAEDCAGVRVWHTVELDPCCPNWELACKNPSGFYMAIVGYTADGDKAYAITGGSDVQDSWFDPGLGWGAGGDETAFSVSLDDGVSWNQIGLIDTNIDVLSDLAVCPDCSVIYLSSIHSEIPPCDDGLCCDANWHSYCDSIWRSYDNGDTWERVFHGDWVENGDELLLRLPCDDTEDCCTLYLGVQGTDELYYTRDCGQCWTQTPGTKIPIQDFAVETENTIYVLDEYGNVSMSTQFGRRWSDEVDTEVGSGHTIASCCNEGFVVVGGHGDEPVAWSEDGGETWSLTDDLPGDSYQRVHVACDPVCDNTIYAALCSAPGKGGIYRTDVTDGAWDDLNAEAFPYYGIALSRQGVLYAVSDSMYGYVDPDNPCDTEWGVDIGTYYAGVARNLDPCETACCGTEDWDYLVAGLTPTFGFPAEEAFHAEPSALRICGCLSMDTNSILWAIDTDSYDVSDGSDGTVWTYEDCTAKAAPEPLSPTCGEDIPSEPCEGCTNADINLCWTKICGACTYDIEIATDEDFNQTVNRTLAPILAGGRLYKIGWDPLGCFEPAECDNPCFLVPSGALQAGTTYYWRARVHSVDTGDIAHSQWSETCSFNVMSGVGVTLLAPEIGAMGIGTEGVGFSWTSVGGATSYSFVFSENSDLSGALASEELSGTAYTYTGMLDYSAPYFWQVTAWKNGSELSTSDVGSFTTAGEPPPPPPPPPEPTPPPDIVIPPAEQVTPGWIIAAIAIGAALVVVIIVFIVRSRRP